MNQHDQILREALRALDFIKAAATPDSGIEYHQIRAIEQALAAEPAPLVRLTEHQLEQLGCSYAEDFDFANAIMDAMERVNS